MRPGFNKNQLDFSKLIGYILSIQLTKGKTMYPVKKTTTKSSSPHRFPKSPYAHVTWMRQWINESIEKKLLPEEIKKVEGIMEKEEENNVKNMRTEDEIFDFA